MLGRLKDLDLRPQLPPLDLKSVMMLASSNMAASEPGEANGISCAGLYGVYVPLCETTLVNYTYWRDRTIRM